MNDSITKGIPFEQWCKEDSCKCYDRSLCPLCGKKLVKKYEGFACVNHVCRLFYKLGKGWIYYNDECNLAKKKNVANLFFNNDSRLRLRKEWIIVKQQALIRDNYSCTKCNKEFDTWKCIPLEVHHIIPASEEMALYLDLDNLITLCDNCHEEIHSSDKYKFK